MYTDTNAMNSQTFKKQIKKLPNTPGVYFFKGASWKVLYIGKATSLKDRVRSYDAKDLIETRGKRLVKMVEEAKTISYKKTDSVLEALMLEAYLIKLYKPTYNVQEKDDKSYTVVGITEEDFPRVLILRERDVAMGNTPDLKRTYGPFVESKSIKESMKIIRKIIPFRNKCESFNKDKKRQRRCFNAEIGLCPGVCDGSINKKEYQKSIKKISLILEGKISTLVRQLEKEMKHEASKKNLKKLVF